MQRICKFSGVNVLGRSSCARSPRMRSIAVLALVMSNLVVASGLAATTLSPGEISLSVEGDRISLETRDAPLRELLLRLGDALQISIEAYRSEETVTTAFHDLPLEAAMRRISTRTIYVHDEQSGRITKILVLPEGEQAAMPADETAQETAPKPFTFEFDPSQHLKK